MTADKTPEKINKMFDEISYDYDFMNNLLSFGMHKLIKKQAVKLLDIKDGDNIADLCSGTGDIARLIKKQNPNVHITGVDFSERMVKLAKKNNEILRLSRHSEALAEESPKKQPQNDNINFFQGDVTNLPFPDNSFDIVTMTFGLRNIYSSEKAVEEVCRILKPNGIFMHLDFGEKNLPSRVFDIITLFFARIFSNNYSAYSYLIKSKQEFLTPDDLIKDFEKKGFKLKKRQDYLFKVISCQILIKADIPKSNAV